MADTLGRVVVYWAEADGDRGWCYAAHYTRADALQSVPTVDTSSIDDSEEWTEAQAIAWAERQFGTEVSIEIGANDIV